MSEVARSMIIVWGKACALCVLLMSFSGGISRTVGVEYLQYPSFALCAAAAVAFLLSSSHMATAASRRVFGGLVLGLNLVWCAILLCLQWLSVSDGAIAAPLSFAFATCGRLVTLFVNIQWNFHYSLNPVRQAGRLTAAATLLAAGLFLCSQLLDGKGAAVFVVAVLSVSCVLNLLLVMREPLMASLPTALSAIETADRNAGVSSQSVPRTRFLYFGTRVVYGLSLGLLLCLASTVTAPMAQKPMTTVICIVILVLALGLVWLTGKGGIASCYAVSVAPLISALLIALAFLGSSPGSLFGLLVVFAELAWCAQNLFQLPTYRRMTAMNPATFSYREYAAQIIPYYFAVAVFLPMVQAIVAAGGIRLVVLAGTVLFVVLFGFSIGAMVRHGLQYQPASGLGPDDEPEGRMAASRAEFEQLTPREHDVLALLASGYSRPYIAKTLYLADGTVKTHIRHIYGKLGVNSQDELIEFVRQAARS